MENEHLILHSAMESNILPIISACDAKCVFCSHKNNPDGIRVVSIPPRNLDEIEWTLGFLNSKEKITIGESATRIIEGEPLCHPDFVKIIRMVRKKFCDTLISITTNGHRLDEKMVCFLKKVEPVVINFSLNSATVQGRSLLMGDDRSLAEHTIIAVKLLQNHQVPFHGSIVAMPHLVGWEDIAKTVRYLAKNGAMTVRIFMPGYSTKATNDLRFDFLKMHQELTSFVEHLNKSLPCPLLLEPPFLSDLTPVVAGVMSGSKAYEADLRRGDVINDVNGLVPRSRVEGWNLLQQPGEVCARLIRNGNSITLRWNNIKGGNSGAIMDYDFDMRRMEDMKRIIDSYSGKILLMSSELGFPVLTAVFQLLQFPQERVDIKAVKNNLFGGSIQAAGLLTVVNFSQTFKICCNCNYRPELILLPQEAFDCQGYDLMGQPYWQLTDSADINVKIV